MNKIKAVFEPGTAVPGLDNYECPLRERLKNMEKVNIGQYLFAPGTCVPGMDNFSSKSRDIIKNLEK